MSPNPNSAASPPDSDRPKELVEVLESYLRVKGKGQDGSSGTYRRNASREITQFIDWLANRDIRRLDEIDEDLLAEYVNKGILSRELSARSVNKYYDYISAWIGWCHREGLVAQHYGIRERPRERLPDETTRKERLQQSWQQEERVVLLRHVNEQAAEAIDKDGVAAYRPVRDWALVSILAYSGVRGSELLGNPDDNRRDGAQWRDLGDEYASLRVFGKSQEWEQRSIPPQAHGAIEQWERVLDPASEWPIIPTFHFPKLYEPLRTAGVRTDAIQGHDEIFAAYADAGITPPALMTDGARKIMQRLTDNLNIDIDEGYLQLHGARRGVGRVLALQQGADAAADQLGNSVEVVEERYSDILASERAEMTGEAFEKHDSEQN